MTKQERIRITQVRHELQSAGFKIKLWTPMRGMHFTKRIQLIHLASGLRSKRFYTWGQASKWADETLNGKRPPQVFIQGHVNTVKQGDGTWTATKDTGERAEFRSRKAAIRWLHIVPY